jgi:hypothetical protein
MVYLSLYYSLTTPRCSLVDAFLAIWGGTFATSGIGYLISLTMSPRNAQLAGVVVALLFSMVAGANPTLSNLDDMGFLGYWSHQLSYARWMLEALYVREVSRWPGVWHMQITGYMSHYGYQEDNYGMCILALVVLGLTYRLLALLALLFINRHKQR